MLNVFIGFIAGWVVVYALLYKKSRNSDAAERQRIHEQADAIRDLSKIITKMGINEAESYTRSLEHYVTAHGAQLTELTAKAALCDTLVEQQNQLALFLRANYATEISAGLHAGREVPEIVIGYLTKEREVARKGGAQ